MIGEITKNTKDHKGTQSTTQGAGRACAQGARPARRPVGRGGLRTPRFGRGAQTRPWGLTAMRFRRCRRGGDAAPENGEQRTENRTPDKRATNEALCKVASAAKPSLQASKLPHNY